jgi:hypothetical protein
MLQHLRPTNPQIGRAKVLGCFFFGDDRSHRAVIGEGPRFPWSHVAGRGGLFERSSICCRIATSIHR